MFNTIFTNLSTYHVSLFNTYSSNFSQFLRRNKSTISAHYSTSTSKNLKTYNPWQHKNINLSSGNEYIERDTIQDFLSSLDKIKNYVLIIVIITEQGMYMAPKQKIQNISYFSSSETLQIRINSELSNIVEHYHIESVYNVVFRYREFVTQMPIIMPSTFPKSNIPLTRKEKNNVFTDFYAPLSIDHTKYGQLIEDKGDIKTYLYKDRFLLEREFMPIDNTEIYNTNVLNKNNKELITSFKDERIKHSHFIRYINGYSLHINSGKITMFESALKSKFIQSSFPDYIPETEMTNFITYDLECYLDENNNFVPYAAGWHKNGITKTYYLTEFTDPNSLILKSLEDLFVKENKNCIIYVHNNKKFDSIFILNALISTDYKLDSLNKGENILSLSVTKNSGKKNSIKLIFKDSYLLLPSSLRDLCRSYKVDSVKGHFPHSFASLKNLNYVGTIPSFKFFPLDSFNNFKEYFILAWTIKNNWNFRDEVVKYLQLDVVSLYKIILVVRKLTYKEEKVDITKVLSNAGLSFRIFKINYLSQIPMDIINKKNEYSPLEWKKIVLKYTPNIAILTKNEYTFMVKAYFGGLTETYIPFIKWGYYYDINSQYPFAMKKFMPVGNPTYSTDTDLDNYFGIVKAKITTPEYLKYPILPVRCEDGRIRCVLGEWIGTYCSEELKNARDNYGYKIQVMEGYKFEQGKIFDKFVDHFYNLKSLYKGTALGSIYKLILNSLYGRFGMKPIRIKTDIMDQFQTEKTSLTHNILNIRDLGHGKEMVTYEIAPLLEKSLDNIEKYVSSKISAETQESHFDINVAISIFISAYARIHIHSYIKKYNLKCYNMDTDSLVTDQPLPKEEVGSELGKMKLEYRIIMGYHCSPKTYYHLPLHNQIPVIKAKGAGKDIPLQDFEKLIKLETIIYNKEKWFIDRENLTIQVRNIPLKIKGGTNKRRMIVRNGVWIDTEPLYYHEIPINNEFVTTYIQDLLPAPDYKLLPAPVLNTVF